MCGHPLWMAPKDNYQNFFVLFLYKSVKTIRQKNCKAKNYEAISHKTNFKKPDVPDNFKEHKSKTIPKNIILSKSKYDFKTRY